MMWRKLFTAMAAVVALAGCSGDSSGPGDGTAQVTLLLTDAPGDIKTAMVTIDEIYLQGGDGGRVVLWMSR
jgi:ABC-type glycerol-3-phosphate transport system substrate-binding protein